MLFEKSTYEGQVSNYGAVRGRRITVDGRSLQSVSLDDAATGKAAYYDEQGRSLKRSCQGTAEVRAARHVTSRDGGSIPSTRSIGRISVWITRPHRISRRRRSGGHGRVGKYAAAAATRCG